MTHDTCMSVNITRPHTKFIKVRWKTWRRRRRCIINYSLNMWSQCLYHINNNILIILTTVVFQDIFLHTISYTPTCYYHLRITTGLTHPLNNNTISSINTIHVHRIHVYVHVVGIHWIQVITAGAYYFIHIITL